MAAPPEEERAGRSQDSSEGSAFERGQPAGDRAAQALEVAQPLALRGQLGLLRLARGRALDLLELPHQQVELAIARARARLQLIQRRLGRARLGVRLRAGRAALRLLRPAEAVEDVQLRGGERELAVLVLAVEGQQRAADVAQVGRRGAAPAEVGARAALGATPAARARAPRRPAAGGRPARRADPAAARTRPRRRPPPPPGARCPAAACRPAAGRARGRARSCPRPSRPSARSAPARGAVRRARSAAGSRRGAHGAWARRSTSRPGTDPASRAALVTLIPRSGRWP